MAGTITQLIKMAGSDTIKAQFKEMGDEGEKAFGKTRSAINHLNTDMATAGKTATTTGDAFFSSGAKASLAVSGIVGLGIAVYKLAQSYLASAEAAAKAVTEQAAAATRAGQTSQNYQQLIGTLQLLGLTHAEAEAAIKKFGEGSAEAYAKGIAKLKELGITFNTDTVAGAKAASEAVSNLGGKFGEAGGKIGQVTELMKRAKAVFDPMTGTLTQNEAAWGRLADSLLKIQDPAQRTAFLMNQFGPELGRRLAQGLAGGSAEFAKVAADFKRLSGDLTQAQIDYNTKTASAFEIAMMRLGIARRAGQESTGLAVAEQVTPLINQLTEATLLFNKALDDFIRGFGSTVSERFTDIGSKWEQLKQTFNTGGLLEALKREFSSLTFEFNPEAFKPLIDAASAAFDTIMEKAKAAWDYISKLLTQSPERGGESGAPGLSDGPGFASGGFTGPGGKYQPAGIVHRGEYVQPQNVVRGAGVLSFMEGLRRSGGDLSGMIERFRGYADGGLVGMSGIPAMAQATAGGRPLVFNFPSGARFNGSVVDVMGTFEREALALQNSSTGTLPSWVGGR
jgi:hypothetical protein